MRIERPNHIFHQQVFSFHHGLCRRGHLSHHEGYFAPQINPTDGDPTVGVDQAASAGNGKQAATAPMVAPAACSSGKQRGQCRGGGVQGQPHRFDVHSIVPRGIRPAGWLAVASQVGGGAELLSSLPGCRRWGRRRKMQSTPFLTWPKSVGPRPCPCAAGRTAPRPSKAWWRSPEH